MPVKEPDTICIWHVIRLWLAIGSLQWEAHIVLGLRSCCHVLAPQAAWPNAQSFAGSDCHKDSDHMQVDELPLLPAAQPSNTSLPRPGHASADFTFCCFWSCGELLAQLGGNNSPLEWRAPPPGSWNKWCDQSGEKHSLSIQRRAFLRAKKMWVLDGFGVATAEPHATTLVRTCFSTCLRFWDEHAGYLQTVRQLPPIALIFFRVNVLFTCLLPLLHSHSITTPTKSLIT